MRPRGSEKLANKPPRLENNVAGSNAAGDCSGPWEKKSCHRYELMLNALVVCAAKNGGVPYNLSNTSWPANQRKYSSVRKLWRRVYQLIYLLLYSRFLRVASGRSTTSAYDTRAGMEFNYVPLTRSLTCSLPANCASSHSPILLTTPGHGFGFQITSTCLLTPLPAHRHASDREP